MSATKKSGANGSFPGCEHAQPSGPDATACAPQFSPRRGRPTIDQAAAISQSILHAAAELFLERGFEATSMEAISQAARVPRSTLYKRFSTKLSLLQAVATERVARWSATSVQRNSHLADNLPDRLKQHAEQVLYGATSDEVRAFLRLTTGPWEGSAEVRKILNDAGYTTMVGILEWEIQSFGVADGALPKDARIVAEALMAMLTGWLAAREADGGVSQRDAKVFAHAAVELLIRGRPAW
jgi:TetR/AcrR family transcriptional repressor of mexJK operon